MRIAYFDCFSGISGDMVLGALVDAGVPLDELESRVRGLGVPGWGIRAERVTRQGIAGTNVTVLCEPAPHAPAGERGPTKDELHRHSHHEHSHGRHGPSRPEHHCHGRREAEAAGPHEEDGGGAHPHRGLSDIEAILQSASLSPGVKERSLEAFRRLAEAEARVHNRSVEEIHFHEVGALDCIVDIVGTMVGLEILGVEACYASPVPTGSGFVRCAHGSMPVPAPGTAELLKGIPLAPSDVQGELTTPTGATLLATLCKGFGPRPAMVVDRVAYGAGKKEFGDQPNLLRVYLGDLAESTDSPPKLVKVLETNLDDLNPELYPYVMERLFGVGALDVTFTPIIMKKGRPAVQLRVLAPSDKEEALCRVLFEETSAFGLRSSAWTRRCLEREWREVQTPWGPVRIKVGRLEGKIVAAKPEYEDCRQLAHTRGVALKEVHAAALSVAERAGLVAGGKDTG